MSADAPDSLAAVLAAHEASWWGFGSYIKCSCAAWRSLVTDEDDAGLYRAHVADHLAKAVAADKAEAVAYWKGRAQEAWRREDRLANDLLIASSDKAEAVRAGRAEAWDEALGAVADGIGRSADAWRERMPADKNARPVIAALTGLASVVPATDNPYRAEAEQGGGK